MKINYYCSADMNRLHGVTRVNSLLLGTFEHEYIQVPDYGSNVLQAFHRRMTQARGLSHALNHRDALNNVNIVTVHDMIPWLYHELYDSAARRWHLLRRVSFHHNLMKANKVVAVSEQARWELTQLGYHCDDVIINPMNPRLANLKRDMPRKRFLLLVGSNDPRKGWERAIPIAARLNMPLIWIGQRMNGPVTLDYERRVLTAAQNAGVRMIRIPNASDDTLAKAYSQAHAMLVTSRYEGFCLPIIEALYYELPVFNATDGCNGYMQRNFYGLIPKVGIETDFWEVTECLNDLTGCYDIPEYLDKWRGTYESLY